MHSVAELTALPAEAGQLVAAKARAQDAKSGESEAHRMMVEAKLPSVRTEYAAFANKLGLSVQAGEYLFIFLANKLDIQTRWFVQLIG